jgi:hypothetical protein
MAKVWSGDFSMNILDVVFLVGLAINLYGSYKQSLFLIWVGIVIECIAGIIAGIIKYS